MPLSPINLAVLVSGSGTTLQNFIDQIVHDVMVVSSECPDELGNVVVTLHGKRG